MIRVAAIGECMIELRHVDAETLKLGFGGDTLNTAVYLSRAGADLGIAVDYVTALGDDPYSAHMAEAWRSEGVGTDLVARLPGRLPGLYIIRTDERGERSFTYFRTAAAARDMLRAERGVAMERALRGFTLIFVSGITLAILDDAQRRTLLRLLREARRGGTRIAFDSNYRPAGWRDAEEARRWVAEILPGVDIALPTLEDERRLFDDVDAEACISRLHAQGVGEIALKLGADGCLVSTGGRRHHVAAAPVPRPVDTTAAGDAFNAAYLAARLSGRDLDAAGAAGNRLAAVVIQHRGAIIPRDSMPRLAGN